MSILNRRGVAMLTSLGVLVILGLLGGVFLAHMRLESAYAGRDAHQLKAHYLAVAGVEDAIARLAADSPLVDSYADIWWMGSSPGMTPLGQGGYTLTVWDEAARIDVMNASPQMLGTLIGGDAEALALILNFRSSRKLFTIADFAAADLKAGALDKLTALGTALDIRKVNINTAGADVIAALPGMDAEAAQIIVEFRKGPDGEEGTADDFVFADPADLVKAPGLGTVRTAPAIPFLKSNSNIFRIESVGAVVEGPRTVSARKIISVVKRDQNGRIHIESWENS